MNKKYRKLKIKKLSKQRRQTGVSFHSTKVHSMGNKIKILIWNYSQIIKFLLMLNNVIWPKKMSSHKIKIRTCVINSKEILRKFKIFYNRLPKKIPQKEEIGKAL
jgi:hypothetical protein